MIRQHYANIDLVEPFEYQRTPKSKIVVSLKSDFDKSIDIRWYFLKDNGEWKPTKKGIYMNVREFYENIWPYLDKLREKAA